jgi:hypothetical protein
MLPTLVFLLSTIASTENLEFVDPIAEEDVWTAPALPEWPADLPPKLEVPKEAECFLKGDVWSMDEWVLGEGLYIPKPRGDAEGALLSACLDMPELVQMQLDRIRREVLSDFVSEEVDRHVSRAQADMMQEQESGGFLSGLALTVVIVATALGFAAGTLLGGYVIAH